MLVRFKWKLKVFFFFGGGGCLFFALYRGPSTKSIPSFSFFFFCLSPFFCMHGTGPVYYTLYTVYMYHSTRTLRAKDREGWNLVNFPLNLALQGIGWALFNYFLPSPLGWLTHPARLTQGSRDLCQVFDRPPAKFMACFHGNKELPIIDILHKI